MKVALSAALLAVIPLLPIFTLDALPPGGQKIAMGVSLLLLGIATIGMVAIGIPFLVRTFLRSAADEREFRRLSDKEPEG